MVSAPRILRVEPAMKGVVEDWLKAETTGMYMIVSDQDSVEVGFGNIDDAFRFRIQFDEELVN